MIEYPCGCINWIHPKWGVLNSVGKCAFHGLERGANGMDYFMTMGAFVEGVPQNALYVAELTECLTAMGCPILPRPAGSVLEVGMGIGQYVAMLLKLGYAYTGIDQDAGALKYVESAFGSAIVPLQQSFEDMAEETSYDLILAAHVVEHFSNAPRCLAKMRRMLKGGGRLILILPDDSDPVNPDHQWFFNEFNIRTTLERLGFVNIQTTTRQRIPREEFIYVNAECPAKFEPGACREQQRLELSRVPGRAALATLCNEHGLLGTAVEIGVHRGVFAAQFLDLWKGSRYIGVDTWRVMCDYQNERPEIISPLSREHDYRASQVAVARFAERAILFRATSADAARLLSGDVDFVYVDANHAYNFALADIKLWWDKLQPGGIMAGHDYDYGWSNEVGRAVREFADSVGRTIRLVPGVGEAQPITSWYINKTE